MLPITALLPQVIQLQLISSKTYKNDLMFVYPDIFNVPTTVELLFNNVFPDTFNVPLMVVLLLNV